jgi:5-(carboxyamino)imidazole ribonucleotide synthase
MSAEHEAARQTSAPLLPGATLGVMGGGQLGRMFVHAAQRMGYFTAVLDPDPDSPAGRVSHHHIQTAYTDAQGLAELTRISAAITTEFENVPAQSLEQLARLRPVAPGAACVAIAQDRIAEKAHFNACANLSGVGCAPHAVIRRDSDLATVDAHLLPGILKTARMGYDGKGQQRVQTAQELAQAWGQMGRVDCVLEKMLPLQAECSVLVARGRDGQMVTYPVQRNVHIDGILALTQAHADCLPAVLAGRAQAAARTLAQAMGYVGLLCIEFFVVRGPHGLDLVVNEMAPRPHNSGHHTLDAFDQSQFDMQVRAMAGLPLPQPRQHSPALMLNLLGDIWFDAQGRQRTPDWASILAQPGTHLHLYGKTEARRGRKMGHLTITGANLATVQSEALICARHLDLPVRAELEAMA